MQQFKSASMATVFGLDDSVDVSTDSAGHLVFRPLIQAAQTITGPNGPVTYPAMYGSQLNLPSDTVAYAPTAAEQLATAQQTQIGTISQGCELSIIDGFTSSALGAAYTYPSKPTDQLNLLGEHSASMNPNNPTTWSTKFWCADANGVWDIRVHTAAQIQQVFTDGVARKLACIEQNKALATQVMAAADVPSVQAILWVAP